MEFLNEEVVSKAGLTPEQIEAIKPAAEGYIADLKKQWDGKANSDAEGIINGALSKIIETTKIDRKVGEKAADYIARVSEEHLSSKRSEIETAKLQYEQKLKEFKGDEATKAELDAAKAKLDDAQKKLADYDVLKAKAEKLDPLETEYKSMKMQVAFSSVKPTFPENVNPYESKAKWEDFVKDVQSKYTIELVDGEAMAIDKENQYKQVKLKDLLAADKNITELAQGRKQEGVGAKVAKAQKIEGVPFDVPEGSTRPQIRQMLQDHLIAKEGLKSTSQEYSKRFAELWSKIPTQ